MADLYSLVKKQDEKIDDLLKTAKENKDLLTDIAIHPVVETLCRFVELTGLTCELVADACVKRIFYILVKSVLKGDDEGFCQFFGKLREVKTFEGFDFLFGECRLYESFYRFVGGNVRGQLHLDFLRDC